MKIFSNNKCWQQPAYRLTKALSLLTLLAYAAASEAKSWYQIEMIVFSRNSNYSYEALPKNIALAYPTNIRYLNNGEQSDTESGLAFIPVNKEELSLNREKQLINQERGVKILFHKAWRQPIYGEKNAVSVVIEGGNGFGEHTELEGSITIILKRYLHAKTNLWFTQFEPNYGQEDLHWPELPSKPGQDNSAELGGLNSDSYNQGNYFGDRPQNKFAIGGSSFSGNHGNDISKSPYVIRRIHTLKQSRRMRSGELHYIDHPLSGVLMLIKPYAPRAQAEPNQDAETTDAGAQAPAQ